MLKEKIKNDTVFALKSGDAKKTGTLRFLLSAIQSREIEKRGKGGGNELTEEETADVLEKEIKKRKEAIALYTQGGRSDLAEKETAELNILKEYAPEEMSEDEIKTIVKEVITRLKPQSAKELGSIMKEVKEKTGRRTDGATIARLVKQELEN